MTLKQLRGLLQAYRIYKKDSATMPNILPGLKTYLAAAGLLGLALYQFSQSDYPHAMQSLMAALAAFGLRQAIANQTKS